MERIIKMASVVKEEKRKSIFKVSEELHQRLEKQRQDRLNTLTDRTTSSWLARQLIQNAAFGITGNLRPPNDEKTRNDAERVLHMMIEAAENPN